MVITNDAVDAEAIVKLRNYGQSKRYYHDSLGFNSRLDEIQAAILSTQLEFLPEWTSRRRDIARLFYKNIKNKNIFLPRVKDGVEHVYHLFVIRHPNRDALRVHLSEHGIGTQIHYPVPCHMQEAYDFLGVPQGRLPLTEHHAQTVLSLPNYPELTDNEILYICDVLNKF